MSWNEAVTSHPELSGTDKLVYHLMEEFKVQKTVAQMIGKNSRVVRRSVQKLRQLGFDPIGQKCPIDEPDRTIVSYGTGQKCPTEEFSTGQMSPMTGQYCPIDGESPNAHANITASPYGEANLCTTPPTPPAAPLQEGGKEGEKLYVKFPSAPSKQDCQALHQAGFRYDGTGWGDPNGGPIDATPERCQRVDLLLARYPGSTADPPKLIERRTLDPQPAPQLPDTDPDLQPVYEQLQQMMPPQRFKSWFGHTALTADGDRVTLWAISPTAAQYIQEHYHEQLQAAFTAADRSLPATIHYRPLSERNAA